MGENVGIDPGSMSELLDDPWPRHCLQMTTRLAELHTEAFDLADAEALADEAVHVHIAHRHLPASLSGAECGILDDLGGDERQRLPRRGSVGVKVTVTLEPLAGKRLH